MNDSTVKTFVKAIKAEKKDPSPYDTTAKVTRVEGNTAWVHISGGVDETPVKMTVDAKVGDEVQVRVGGGKAWITGNATAPPTDDTAALAAKVDSLVAQEQAEKANKKAVDAEAVAQNALNASREVAQYFWFNSTDSGADEGTGAHVTEISQQDFVSDPANGGGNVLVRSDGISVRDGTTELASFGENILLGSLESGNVRIGSDGLNINSGNIPLASYTSDGIVLKTPEGADALSILTSGEQVTKTIVTDINSWFVTKQREVEPDEPDISTFIIGSSNEPQVTVQVSDPKANNSATTPIRTVTITKPVSGANTIAASSVITINRNTTAKAYVYYTYAGRVGLKIEVVSSSYDPLPKVYCYAKSISYTKTVDAPLLETDGLIKAYNLILNNVDILNPTLDSTGLTPYSDRVTISDGGVIKIGKWRFVQLDLKVNTSLAANNYWAVLGGFDSPVTSGYAALGASVGGQKGGAISAYINSSNNLVIETDNSALSNGWSVEIAGWYIAQ